MSRSRRRGSRSRQRSQQACARRSGVDPAAACREANRPSRSTPASASHTVLARAKGRRARQHLVAAPRRTPQTSAPAGRRLLPRACSEATCRPRCRGLSPAAVARCGPASASSARRHSRRRRCRAPWPGRSRAPSLCSLRHRPPRVDARGGSTSVRGGRVPRRLSLMLPGFRSRWTMPSSCAPSSASATCRAIATASANRDRPARRCRSASVGPFHQLHREQVRPPALRHGRRLEAVDVRDERSG